MHERKLRKCIKEIRGLSVNVIFGSTIIFGKKVTIWDDDTIEINNQVFLKSDVQEITVTSRVNF